MLDGAGCRLQVYDYGNDGAPPMLLVHGIQDFALALEPLAEAFRDKYRVVSCDLRGHGDSDKPGVYTMAHHLADLHALFFQLEMEKPVLVGHSLGSQIVCQYGGVFPEVPRAIVSIDGLGPPVKEVVLDTEDKQWRTQEGLLGLLRGAEYGRPMMGIDDATALFQRFHPRLDPDWARQLVEIGCDEHPHGGLKWKWDPLVTSVGLFSTPESAEERFGWIQCPVLLATAGEVDEFWVRRTGLSPENTDYDPQEIERRVGLFKNATHVEIAGAGHHIHYDEPAELIRVMGQFLDTV
jgi:pimeloyl-ACP methyl ester carboxylesterase